MLQLRLSKCCWIAGEILKRVSFKADRVDVEDAKWKSTDAIGKAKELIESCCKTILNSRKIAWDKNWDVGQLTGETLKILKLMPRDIPEDAPAAAEMKALLGNLRAIATNVAALRNHYGSGHGKSADYKGLSPRHAKLAVGSSITLVEFLWETHLDRPQGKWGAW